MSLKRSIVFSFGAQVPAVLLSFLSGVCITRMLHEEGRGVFSMLQADVAILSFLLSFSMPSVLVYFLAKGEHSRASVVGLAASLLVLLGAVIVATLVLVLSGVIDGGILLPKRGGDVFYSVFIAVSLFLTLAQSFLAATFLGVREFRVGNRMYVLTAVVNLLVYGGMFVSSERDVPVAVAPVLLAGMLAQLVMTVVWLVHYVAFVRTRPALWSGGSLLRPAIAFSILGYFADLLNQLNYRLDIWLLGDMRDMGELGLYAVAVGVAQFFFMVPEPIARVLQPHLVSDDQEDLLDKFKLYSRLCVTLVLAGGTVAVLVSEWVFPLIYGEPFRPSAAAFRLLMPGIVFACVSKMLVLLVVRTGNIKYNVLASGAGLVITLVFDLLLIPAHGLLGAAVASSLAYFTVMMVVALVVFLRLGVPFGNYFILMPKDVAQLLGRSR